MRGALVTLALAPLLLIACSQEIKENKSRWVRFQEVIEEKEVLRTYSGYARAAKQTHLSFRVGGTVEQLDLLVGTEVKKGEVLARLDPKDYVLKVEQANSTLLEAEAQKRKSEASYERIATLYETKSASRSELDAKRTEYESRIAKVQAATSNYNLAKLQLSYTLLKAPMDGVVASKLVGVSENVMPGQNVCEMHSVGKFDVMIALPEKLINEVRVGSRAEVVFNALPTQIFSAFVIEIGVASAKTTVFPVTLELIMTNEKIRPGMTADVIFRVPLKTKRLLIPPYAVFEENGKSSVFLLEEEGGCTYVRKREIQLGELTAEGLVVLKGLRKKDRIVTAGIYQIEEGEKVIIRCD